MRSTKILNFNGLMLITAAILFTSCQNDDKDNFNVSADVVFLHKVIDNDTVTGIAYYAHGNKVISEAAVTIPESGETTMLEKHPNSSYTYYLEPSDEDYSDDENILTGSYVFNINGADGELLEVSDVQVMDNLGFAQIDSSGFSDVQEVFYFTWEEVEDAQNYIVFLLNSEGKTIFTGHQIDNETHVYYLSTRHDFGKWTSYPQKGESYTLRIQSYRYDADATNNNYVYNIQEISIADYPLTWELE